MSRRGDCTSAATAGCMGFELATLQCQLGPGAAVCQNNSSFRDNRLLSFCQLRSHRTGPTNRAEEDRTDVDKKQLITIVTVVGATLVKLFNHKGFLSGLGRYT